MALSLLFAAALSFASVNAPRVVLEHVRVIDGTGAPAIDDRNVTIENGRIAAIAPGADEPPREGTIVLDLRGKSVMPGIVGMHEHLFYISRAPNPDLPSFTREMALSAPVLYLANGVTTARTTGSIAPILDLQVKRLIDAGRMPGPNFDITGPYLDGVNTGLSRALAGPDDARQTVAYWAERGVTSFKAYGGITRDELRAAVDEAHKHGLKVTGHLCSVTYAEAAEIGIDNLEHGFFVNTALDPDKKPDTCSSSRGDYTLEHLTPDDARRLIAMLVQHHVAITSTLVSTALSADAQHPLPAAAVDAMSPAARDGYLRWRNRAPDPESKAALLLKKDMALERAFVDAGGLLISGPDPVGIGGNIPGFGDHRQIELLVDAGFTPLQAIRIATLNGAAYLGRQDRIGSIAVGKNADLIVINGDPSTRIADVENVETVFKDGVGYDSAKLLASVKGLYGEE